MDTLKRLWQRSAPWRWTCVLTTASLCIAIVLGPWTQPRPPPAGLASYTPAPTNVGGGPFIMGQPSRASPRAQSAGAASRSGHGFDKQDANFDGPLAPRSGLLPTDTELHLVGVYEGAPIDGKEEQPWWQNCLAFQGDTAAMMECHSKFTGKSHSTKTVLVTVSRHGNPMILVLMSYEPTLWKLSVSKDTSLLKVILAGYHGQEISGIADDIPVEARSYEASNCPQCSKQGDYFYAYKRDSTEYVEAVKKLLVETGLTPTSFQGSYRADEFAITPSSTAVMTESLVADDLKDIYTDREFSNEVRVGSVPISLPEGRWRVISYFNNPSNRGRDQVFVLSASDGETPNELLAIRLQTVTDGSGFLRNTGCDRKDDYVNVSSRNESFEEQLCYWVGHVPEAWKQPVFSFAATRLKTLGVQTPDTVVASSFHKSTKYVSLDVLHYAYPPANLSKTVPYQMSSPWNTSNLSQEPERVEFVDERKRLADIWYQLFSMSY